MNVNILNQDILVTIIDENTISVTTNPNIERLGQSAITFEDEGAPLGTQGTATEVNFTGSGVSASRVGAVITVNIPGGGTAQFVISATQPTDNSLRWIDSSVTYNVANPIKDYINGQWVGGDYQGDWYDPISNVVSKGSPLAFLMSGQSNMGGAPYTPQADPTFLGDVVTDNYVTLYNPLPYVLDFNVYNFSNPITGGVDPANPGYECVGGVGSHLGWRFCKLYARKYHRSVRFVVSQLGGQPLKEWESGQAQRIKLKAYADASGINYFDAFIWVHGEAGLGSGSAFSSYRDSFNDLKTYIRAQSWADENTKILATSNALKHDLVIISPSEKDEHENTMRDLSVSENINETWVPGFHTRELQNTSPQDGLHYTTREHDKLGDAIFTTYEELATYGKRRSLTNNFYYRAGSVLYPTSIEAAYPLVDILRHHFSTRTANSDATEISFGFAAGTLGDRGRLVFTSPKGGGNNGEVTMRWRARTDGSTPSVSDDNFVFGGDYNKFLKAVATQLGLTTSSGANASGSAALNFMFRDFSTHANNPYDVSPSSIVGVSSNNGPGEGDILVIVGGSGSASTIQADAALKAWYFDGLVEGRKGRIGVSANDNSTTYYHSVVEGPTGNTTAGNTYSTALYPNRSILSSNVIVAEVTVSGIKSDGSKSFYVYRRGMFRNDGASTLSLISQETTILSEEDAGTVGSLNLAVTSNAPYATFVRGATAGTYQVKTSTKLTLNRIL